MKFLQIYDYKENRYTIQYMVNGELIINIKRRYNEDNKKEIYEKMVLKAEELEKELLKDEIDEKTSEEFKFVENTKIKIGSLGNVKKIGSDNIKRDFAIHHGVYIIKNDNKLINIHKLVADTFIPNPDNLKYILHKDGDKLNNRVDNLIRSSRTRL